MKPISISLSPNTQKDDIFLALKLIFSPWRWKKGKEIKELEEEFKKYFNVKYAFSFNSGRTALLAILKSLDLKKEENGVLVQAFTCNAVINPILWAGLTPIYVDCNEKNFNIDINDLKRKIKNQENLKRTPKVLIVQHNFGLSVEMDKILEICKEKNLILIEDCAHSLGATYNGQKVGTFGKVSFFSFSRDKVISSVFGGMVITNDSFLAEKIKENYLKFNYPGYFWIFQQLLHPVLINWLVLPIYNFLDLGKIILVLSQWFHLLSKAVHWKEKRGEKPDYFPKKFPNGLAVLALNQFKKLENFNQHRKKIANFYYQQLKDFSFVLPPKDNSIFLRFTIKHLKAHEIIYNAWHKENILLGDWYTSPIAPFDTQLDKLKYKIGECKKAERLAKITLNLPTHINISYKEAEKIVKFLKKMENFLKY